MSATEQAMLLTIRDHLIVMVSLVPQSGPLELAHLMADDAKRALEIIETLLSRLSEVENTVRHEKS